jgi:NADH-quinone oxidoreductase subunit L
MDSTILLLPVIIPVFFALVIFLVPKSKAWIVMTAAVAGALLNFAVCLTLAGHDMTLSFPWIAIDTFRIDFLMKLYNFSSMMIFFLSCASLLVIVYAVSFMRGKENLKAFFAFLLLTAGLADGAILADHLILMFFFWESILITIFALTMTGSKDSYKISVKALVLNGTGDFCMILGIALAGLMMKGDLSLSSIQNSPIPLTDFAGIAAFILLTIGALARAGAFPFHTWITDAARESPLPFIAFLPVSAAKLLGVYFLARLTLDFFDFKPGTGMSVFLMSIGAVTILAAGFMALVQKDFKKLLAYGIVSQTGYIIIGLGTGVPAGFTGGLFHLLNIVLSGICLFMAAGSIEKQAGTVNLGDLGGLGKKMPLTFSCFILAACSAAGVPLFGGFFSRELVFEGTIETGNIIFYGAAALGAFLTAAYLLKALHSVFMGKENGNYSPVKEGIKDPGLAMTIPMVLAATLCLLFGVFNQLPLGGLVEPVLGARLEHSFAGFGQHYALMLATVILLVLAFLNHIYGVYKTGKASQSLDHIGGAPVLSGIYGLAEKNYFDPYTIGMSAVNIFAVAVSGIDRGIDWIYSKLLPGIFSLASLLVRKAHTGNYALYLAWSITGMAIIILYFIFH